MKIVFKIKKFFQKNFSHKKASFILMIAAISISVTLIITSGIVGVYSLFSTSQRYLEHIEAIDVARQTQIELDRQYNTWKTLMKEGNDFSTYKRNYHEYSYHLVHVSDLLFNLKLMFSGKPIELEIEELQHLHSNLSKEYLQTLLESQNKTKSEREKTIYLHHIKEKAILQKMDAIVDQIRDERAVESAQMMNFYLRLTAVAVGILSLVAIVMGIFIGNIVIRSQKYLQHKIERRTRDIQNAHQLLLQSEKRYRQLVEGTGNIIITLNKDLIISSANSAVRKIFGINPQELVGQNIIDLIYEGSDGRGMSKKIILEKINQFLKDHNSVNFIADFCSPSILEPKTLDIQLECIQNDETIEILGRGIPLTSACVTKFLTYERLCLVAENYLSDANEISFRLTNMLSNYLDSNYITPIRVALREMIINAIEHGNLEITYEEKTRALAENRYFELLAKRRNHPEFANRKVRIDSIISPSKAIYRITDDGKGFDPKAYLLKKHQITDCHGRGIMMTLQVFDVVRYNKKGNQVLLIKYINNNESQQISGKGLSHCQPTLPV